MIEITRLEQTERGTLGQILVDGKVVCYSLELPWKDNEVNVSCIPTGEYPCRLEYSPRYKRDLFEIKEVPGRSEVKFHKGNYLSDIRGCVLVGTEPGYDDEGNRAVWNSDKAFTRFMAAMSGKASDDVLVRRV